MPNCSNSVEVPRPIPKFSRPPEITSTMAYDSATSMGLWRGKITMAIPRRILVVRLATAARKVAGSEMVPPYSWRLMLRFRVLFDQQLNQRLKQGCASLPNIMDKLEETKIER